MSKFLSLCNQLVSVTSTCKEPLPAGGEYRDRYMEIAGLIRKAGITTDEYNYGMAVVGHGFTFEVRLQKRARIILALSFELSEAKIARRSAGLAELAVGYIRGENARKTNKEMAIICGCSLRHWHRYKTLYTELCDWCNELESDANIKLWRVLENEQESV